MYSFTTINNRYYVTVHGNGWAYEVTHQESGDNLWFQDAIAQYFDCLCE